MTTTSLPAWIMDLLSKRIENKICALWDRNAGREVGLGTGAIVSAGERHVILTCAHVALPFFRSSDARVVLRGGTVIPRESCTLLHADDGRDLAVIGVADKRLSGFSIEEIESIPDYTKHDFSHLDLVVCGYPGEQVTVTPGHYTLSPLGFLTGIQDSPARTRDTLACAYPMGFNLVVGYRGPSRLPRPHGLSGSPLLSIPSPRTPKDEIWTFEDIRIVGVVALSDVRTFLEANNIFPILPLMRAQLEAAEA